MMLSLLSLLVVSSCGSGVDVRVGLDKTLELDARNAPLSSVLECLAERAGFKMVLEPSVSTRQPITLSLTRRTAAAAVVGVLEGRRLNYAYSSDRTGTRVLMLLISGRADRGPGQAGTGGGAPSRPDPRFEPQFVVPEPETEYVPGSIPGGEPIDPAAPSGPRFFSPPGSVPSGQGPLYPEPRALTPLTVRGGPQIDIANGRSSARTGGATGPPPVRRRP